MCNLCQLVHDQKENSMSPHQKTLVTSEAVHVNNTLYISPNRRSFILILSICLSLEYFLTGKNGSPLQDTIRLFYDIPSFLATTNVFHKLRSNCSHMDILSTSFKYVQGTIYTRLHSVTAFVTLSSLWKNRLLPLQAWLSHTIYAYHPKFLTPK